MFRNNIKPKSTRRIEILESRIEALKKENARLSEENHALTIELEACRAITQHAEEAEAEFRNAIEDARRAKEEYESVYSELKLIQRDYSNDMNRLIKQIRKHAI